MNFHLFLQYGLHDDAVSNFPYAFLWIHQLPEYTQVLSKFCWMQHSHKEKFKTDNAKSDEYSITDPTVFFFFCKNLAHSLFLFQKLRTDISECRAH